MKSITLIFLSSIWMLILPHKILAQKTGINNIDWSVAAKLPTENGRENLGVAGAFSGVHNASMLVAGGANFPDKMPWLGGKKAYHKTVYVFRKDGNGKITAYPKLFSLPFSVAYGASISTSQGIFCAGGETENGLSKKVFLLQWKNEKINIQNLPDLPVAVANASITQNNNMIYLAGGETKGGVSNRFFSLDLKTASPLWKEEPPLPKPVSHAVFAVQNNGSKTALYLIGGRKKNQNSTSNLYDDVYAFDLKQQKWLAKKALPYALSAGTGISKGNSFILLFGGDKGETFHKTEELIVAINNEKDPAKRALLTKQKTKLQSAHPGFSRDVLLYNTITDVWTKIDTIPIPTQATTSAFAWDNNVIIPSGEVKAGMRTPVITSVQIR